MAKVKPKKCNTKSEEFVAETLNKMEQMVDEKLGNLKSFIPIIFTVITSVIAFMFVDEIADEKTLKGYMFIIAILLLAFIVLIMSYFVRNYYTPIKMKIEVDFLPYNLNSYCFLSDEDFIKIVSNYAGRSLTDNEMLNVNFLKQKINEYIKRKMYVSIALSIVILGAIIITVALLIGAFLPDVIK